MRKYTATTTWTTAPNWHPMDVEDPNPVLVESVVLNRELAESLREINSNINFYRNLNDSKDYPLTLNVIHRDKIPYLIVSGTLELPPCGEEQLRVDQFQLTEEEEQAVLVLLIVSGSFDRHLVATG